jgi:hypothetical protein
MGVRKPEARESGFPYACGPLAPFFRVLSDSFDAISVADVATILRFIRISTKIATLIATFFEWMIAADHPGRRHIFPCSAWAVGVGSDKISK